MTRIEWCEETWNPITGCSPVSEGCCNCYAERMAKRLAGRHGYDSQHPFQVTLHPNQMDRPFRWTKPRTIFVCSMGDLFHEDVDFLDIANVWDVIFDNPRHTFMVLTKRPKRMAEFAEWMEDTQHRRVDYENVWLGVTAENQRTAEERIPVLLDVPAAKKFVSVEPMLGPIGMFGVSDLDWVICGAETGPGARQMDYGWARDLRDQCSDAGVPFFFKKGNGGEEPPTDLKIREWPKEA